MTNPIYMTVRGWDVSTIPITSHLQPPFWQYYWNNTNKPYLEPFNDPCFEWKGPSFGWFKPKNRGHSQVQMVQAICSRWNMMEYLPTYICLKVNVGKYSIHGASGIHPN